MQQMQSQYIGQPIEMVSIHAAAYGQESGEDRIYTVSTGKPCVLFVLRPSDGTCLRRIPIATSHHSWGMVTAPDGRIYIGGDGRLYRYTPGSEAVEDLGVPIEGESYFWRLAVSASTGCIYGGTYPSGKVFEYNPKSESYRAFGPIEANSQYVRCMDVAGEEVFLGLGVQGAMLYRMNVITGSKQEVQLPEEAAKDNLVYDLTAAGCKLFIRTTPSNRLWVYDLAAERWIDRIEQAQGLDVSPLQEGCPLVYLVREDTLCSYNLETLQLTPLPVPIHDSAKGFGWIRLSDDRDFPDNTLVSMRRNGDFWMYNPDTGMHRTVATSLRGQPIAIQSMTLGPEGDIHMGGYFAGGYARYQPTEGNLTSYKGVGQIEGMVSHEGKIYLGVYTKAKIYEYDPSKPWEENGNPKHLFSLQAYRQDRPYAWVSAGKHVAIGTTPDYGQLGGALTLYDPETGEYEVYEHIVKNQKVVALRYRDGIIYGGTCVWGGLGVQAVETEGKLFIWDPATRSMLDEVVPIEGERAVSDLTFDEDGKLWGITAGYVFRYDLQRRITDRIIPCFDHDWAKTAFFSRGGFLEYIGENRLVGTTLGKLFLLDTEREKLKVLSEDNTLFTLDREGHLYFNRADELHRLDRGLLFAE